jgi:hypothetical protein
MHHRFIGSPFGEGEEPLLHSSSIALSSPSLSPPPSPKKEETKRNLAQLLREIPYYKDLHTTLEPWRVDNCASHLDTYMR